MNSHTHIHITDAHCVGHMIMPSHYVGVSLHPDHAGRFLVHVAHRPPIQVIGDMRSAAYDIERHMDCLRKQYGRAYIGDRPKTGGKP